MTTVPFAKMNGIGNKILVVDLRLSAIDLSNTVILSLSSDSRLSYDQLMAFRDSGESGVSGILEIYNSDGSIAEACGNGMRCVGSWLSSETGETNLVFRTRSGLLDVSLSSDIISVTMPPPSFEWSDIPLSGEFPDTSKIDLPDFSLMGAMSTVSIGNPHGVFWTDKDPDEYNLEDFGPTLEHHSIFPSRANITLAHILSRDSLKIRTWERGAGLTLACGSAACASVVCGVRLGLLDRSVRVHLVGGELQIDWQESDNTIIMSGVSEHEFSGTLDLETGDYSLEQD